MFVLEEAGVLHAAVEWPDGNDSSESLISFSSPVQMTRVYITFRSPEPELIPSFGTAGLQTLTIIISTSHHGGETRPTHSQKVRSQPANQPLQKHLEHSRVDEPVQKPHHGVIEVPEAADADLHERHDGDGDHARKERSEPDRNDVFAQRVGKLGVDDLAVLEEDGKGASGGWGSVVDLRNS